MAKDYSDPGLHECPWCHVPPTIESFVVEVDRPLFFLKHVNKHCPIARNNGHRLGDHYYFSAAEAAAVWNAPFSRSEAETVEWHGIELERSDLNE